MDWTPEKLKSIVKNIGGVEIMAEIMHVTPKTIRNLLSGDKYPSKGSGVAILNLLEILIESLSSSEIDRILNTLRTKNKTIAMRPKRRKPLDES